MPEGSPLFIKVATQDTGGAFFLTEQPSGRKGGPPKHFHLEEDEWFDCLEGEYIVEVGSQRYELKPGTSVLGPRRVPHAFAFVGNTPGRLLIGFTPAGRMEQFFRDWTHAARTSARAPARRRKRRGSATASSTSDRRSRSDRDGGTPHPQEPTHPADERLRRFDGHRVDHPGRAMLIELGASLCDGRRHAVHERRISERDTSEGVDADLDQFAAVTALTVAVRGSPVSSDISPKNPPARCRANSPVVLAIVTVASPRLTTNIDAPGAPSRTMTWPVS